MIGIAYALMLIVTLGCVAIVALLMLEWIAHLCSRDDDEG
jgi:hypothetical protein